MINLTQFYINVIRPRYYALITKIVYFGKHTHFGKNFQTDSIPKITIDKNAKLYIGDNVQFRRNVEIRAHGSSQIIIEDNVRIDRGVRLLSANKSVISIEKGVRIGLYTVFNGGDSITVGEKSLISGFIYLQTSMHNYKGSEDVQSQGYSHAPIIIKKDTWIGTHAVIFPGVTIGERSVVGSNAVVNKSFEKGSIIGGIPAKIINARQTS